MVHESFMGRHPLGNLSEYENSQLLGAPSIATVTGTRRYIRERQLVLLPDHVIDWQARLEKIGVKADSGGREPFRRPLPLQFYSGSFAAAVLLSSLIYASFQSFFLYFSLFACLICLIMFSLQQTAPPTPSYDVGLF
jgi:hypothetical protein